MERIFAEKLASDDAVMITDGKYTVAFSFPEQTGIGTATKSVEIGKAKNSAYYNNLTADNRSVIYQDVVANVDIAYTVQHSVLKEDIILKSKDAPNSFKFRLNARGLTVNSKGNTIALLDSTGKEIFAFAPLYMEDANGKRSENVQLTYASVKDGYEITVSADASFLNAADTAYPVVIDPSVMVTGSSATFDTCVDQEYPNSNYYLSENLWTGGALGTNAMRTYIKFALPSGISVNQITSAYVCMLKKEHQVPTIRAYRVTSSWDSSSVTWNSQPSFTSASPSGTAFNSVGDWYRLDVTAMVKNWLNGAYLDYGMVLKEPSETNSSQKTKFYSSDAPSPNKPELLINYVTYFGSRPYQSAPVGNYANCMGYALECRELVDLNMSRSETVGMTTEQILEFVYDHAITWMTEKLGSANYAPIDNFDSDIETGWFRVVLRVGFYDKNSNGVYDDDEPSDYHWWYQTNENQGQWADKPGENASRRQVNSSGLVDPTDSPWPGPNLIEYNSEGKFFKVRDISDIVW